MNKENNFEKIYKEIDNGISPIRDIGEYEKEYAELYVTELDRDEYARGFIVAAQTTRTALNNLRQRKTQEEK